jgi:hypothetical protein
MSETLPANDIQKRRDQYKSAYAARFHTERRLARIITQRKENLADATAAALDPNLSDEERKYAVDASNDYADRRLLPRMGTRNKLAEARLSEDKALYTAEVHYERNQAEYNTAALSDAVEAGVKIEGWD